MTNTLDLDTSFPRSYECEQVKDLPSGQRFYFPGASTEMGSDGPIIKISPYLSTQWVGVFAYGGDAPRHEKTGLFTFPDPDILCVVTKGAGYLIDVNNSENWKPIEVYPICEAIPVANKNLLVFGNFTEMTAFNAAGIVWTTKRLAWDEIKILQVTDNYIEGETWDSFREETLTFRIDLETGEHTGGIIEE